MYCLDTNIWSQLMRGATTSLRTRLSACPAGKICLSEMARAELLFGAARHTRRKEFEARISIMLAPYATLSFDGGAAVHYADIRAALEKAGTLIGPNDLIIAACARSVNAVMVTDNTREFSRVPGLKVENWLER